MRQILVIFFCVTTTSLQAQVKDCAFGLPVITLDFGDDLNPKDLSLSQLKDNYRRHKGICPNDGHFAFASQTHDCFDGNWIRLSSDHTPGSVNGRMMIVNASYNPATFFSITLNDLKPYTTYEFSAWFVNVCRRGQNCDPTPPEIRIVFAANGKSLSQLLTGPLLPTGTGTWRQFTGNFTTPAAFSSIVVIMDDLTTGGCGNDFAMDDLQVRECRTIIKEQPPAPQPAPIVTTPAVRIPPQKPAEKPAAPQPVIRKKETALVKKETTGMEQPVLSTVVKPVAPVLPVPEVIKKRENPIARKIITPESEITIELYDNGEIDGDTVTIFHNNELIVSYARLDVKPVTVTIKVDKYHPHHELVMVANNLGSIPPNTSLMVVTSRYQRYEVFISSTEKKNAKVVIDLEQE